MRNQAFKHTREVCALIEKIADREVEIDSFGYFRNRGFIDTDCEVAIGRAWNSFANSPLTSMFAAATYYLKNPVRIFKLVKSLYIQIAY